MNSANIKAIWLSSRPPFLILTPSCIFLSYALAIKHGYIINHLYLALAITAALLAHISVNLLNEYHDFKSGLDLKTSKTPFSGGSGSLVAFPKALKAIYKAGVITLLLCTLIGLYLTYALGAKLLPLGVLGVLIVLTYTPWINKSPWICLIAPGLAFGPLMILGCYFVLTGQYDYKVIVLTLIPFFLINNLLLLNQIPDIKADASVGRKHLLIQYGPALGLKVYAAFTLLSILVLLSAIYANYLPTSALIALLPLFACIISFVGVQKNINNHAKLNPYLAINVIAAISTPIILSLCILSS